MINEPTPILYFSHQIDPSFKKAFTRPELNFKVTHIAEKTFLHRYLENVKYFILVSDRSYLEYFLSYIRDNHFEFIFDKISLIVLGTDTYELISGENNLPISKSLQILNFPLDLNQINLTLINAKTYLTNKKNLDDLQFRLEIQTNELRELNDIGVALSAERDPDTLLEMILIKSREITRADAGSLYLVEKIDGAEEDENNYFADKHLRFKLAQCDTVPIDFTESVMPIEKKSIAGHVALTSEILNIPDVYFLPENAEFKHNRSFDESVGYRTKSMLVIPLKNHKDEIIGVLQLINRKRNRDVLLTSDEIIEQEVIEFDEKCVDLASSLASQAAISIENTRLYEEIKNLFEGFIKASVHAIEQRDPTTFGHSERVATLTTEMAKKIDQINTGKFKNIKFSRDDIQQIKYAALLHDFGKIGVRENILVKAKKLFPYELEAVKSRFKILEKVTELVTSNEKINVLLQEERERALKKFKLLDKKAQDKLRQLEEYLKIICEINEPSAMKESNFEKLQEIAKITFYENGRTSTLLTAEELDRLSIARGSLSLAERKEIESHVTHTYNFLKKIPWTKELKGIPYIAYAHHEKLDGSGYPRGLVAQEIPIQSKMMIIADIYDALTAWDRPYKRAVPQEKALQILQWEAEEGKIDADLFKIFLEAKLYELVKKPDQTP